MRGKIAWLKSPVRHRTLAPFGGITRIRFKGSSNWTSQPLRLPRIVELRLRPGLEKSTRHTVCTSAPTGGICERGACSQTANENLSSGRRLLRVRVKDRLPLSILFLPDRGGVVRPRLIFSVVGAFDRHVVGGDNCVGSISHDFVIADRKRFHLPLLHVRQIGR